MTILASILIFFGLSTLCLAILKSTFQARRLQGEVNSLTFALRKNEANLERYVDRFLKANETLENLLHERNDQFDFYSHHNAHLLRAPAARLLGLANVVKYMHEPNELRIVMALMEVEARNMDSVISSLNNMLETDKQNKPNRVLLNENIRQITLNPN